MASDTEIAWLAGFIDGDGCITLARNKSKGFGKPMLVIDNTDLSMLEDCQEMLGVGSIVKKKKYKDNHRQAWSYRVYGANNVRRALSMVQPYLRCPSKLKRCKMITEQYQVVTPRNGHYTDEARATKEAWERKFMEVGEDRGSRAA